MKHWTYVVVEGHCFGDEDENGNNPCGRNVPSPFCLGNGNDGQAKAQRDFEKWFPKAKKEW